MTIKALIVAYRIRVREQIDAETIQDHLERYVQTDTAIENDAWTRLRETKANAQNVPGMQRNVLAAAKNIATAVGLFTKRNGVAVVSTDRNAVDPVDAVRQVFRDQATVLDS